MVYMVGHPVGHDHRQDDPKQVVDATRALHHEHDQGDGGAEDAPQHTRGGQQRVQPRLDVPAGQPAAYDQAPQATPRGAQLRGGERQAHTWAACASCGGIPPGGLELGVDPPYTSICTLCLLINSCKGISF